ncbi:hypothetical protein EDC96DRAFT_586031 [Choanephora cucurbitarum]|nr:hypothetical protein EDC96DRAFT_586031 [Choanephora cucurbitarum]
MTLRIQDAYNKVLISDLRGFCHYSLSKFEDCLSRKPMYMYRSTCPNNFVKKMLQMHFSKETKWLLLKLLMKTRCWRVTETEDIRQSVGYLDCLIQLSLVSSSMNMKQKFLRTKALTCIQLQLNVFLFIFPIFPFHSLERLSVLDSQAKTQSHI